MADAPEQPTKLTGQGDWVPLSVARLQEVLPAYELIELLGAGGMGAVYKARQKSLKRLVAIKILPLGMGADEFQFVERFRNEAQTLAQLNHPAIVNVYDFGETPNGLLYFVMEYVDGTDVHRMIAANGKLTPEHALRITAHVCEALSYAHRNGVVHRDIKPANILINREGHVKVADFGLAKMHDPTQTSGLTRSNMTMGTPDYAAPEVFKTGAAAVDHRADLYAVGVMLYQMLTGEVPRGFFKLPSEQGADPRFDAIIVKAMETDREERYQSAMEVRQALDDILTTPLAKNSGTGAISATAIPQRSRMMPKPQVTQAAPAEPVPSSRAKWMTAAAAIAVFAVGGWYAFNAKLKPAAPSTAAKAAVTGTDAAFLAQVAAAPAEQQVELVAKKIEALNGMPVSPKPVIANGVVTDLILGRESGAVGEAKFGDLSPIAALRGLKKLKLYYLNPSDISFLRGLKIESLTIHSGNFPVDVLRELPLTDVEIRSAVADFSVLARKPLTVLDLSVSPLRDISFVKGMPLTKLNIGRTAVKDLSPIRGLPLKEINCDFVPERDTEILRSIPTLTRINDKPAAVFWTSVGVKATPTAAQAEAPPIDWINALPPEAPPWSAEWGGLKDGVLTATSKFARLFGIMKNGSVRVRVRLAPDYPVTDELGPQLQLDIRHGDVAGVTGASGQLQFQVYVPNRDCTLIYQEKGKDSRKAPALNLWKGQHKSVREAGNAEVDWEFRANGDELSAWADGQLVHSVRDAHVASGYCTLSVPAGLQITRLETTGLIPTKPGPAKDTSTAASANGVNSVSQPLPTIANWRDVTADVRDKARTMAGLRVDADAIRHTAASGTSSIPLTSADAKDYAVRVRHTGEVQVNFRDGDKGFIYVLCQRSQVIFQRYDKGAVSPIVLRQPVRHPAGYDPAKEHETVVLMQGSTIRAWLDGRFVGEAEETTFKTGTTDVLLNPWSIVKQVEVADLGASIGAAGGGWQPIFMQREDFAGDLRGVEFRDGATFIKARTALAPPTSSGGAIRATLRFFATDRTGSLTLRSTEKVPFGEEDFACIAFISPTGGMVMKVRDRTTGSPELKRHDFPLSPSLKLGETFVLELGAVDGKIAVSVNGREVGSVKDTWAAGDRRFGITPSNTEFSEFREVAMRTGR